MDPNVMLGSLGTGLPFSDVIDVVGPFEVF